MQKKEHRIFVSTDARQQWREVKVVNTLTGDLYYYNIDIPMGFIFSEHRDNILNMGWDTVKQFLRKRCRSTSEVDYDTQMEVEKEQQLQWGAWLLKRYRCAQAEKSKMYLKEQLATLYAYTDRYCLDTVKAKTLIQQYCDEERYPECPESYKTHIKKLEASIWENERVLES